MTDLWVLVKGRGIVGQWLVEEVVGVAFWADCMAHFCGDGGIYVDVGFEVALQSSPHRLLYPGSVPISRLVQIYVGS
jgi:hypothetical protein